MLCARAAASPGALMQQSQACIGCFDLLLASLLISVHESRFVQHCGASSGVTLVLFVTWVLAVQAGGAAETAVIAEQLASVLQLSRQNSLDSLRFWLDNEGILPLAQLVELCDEAQQAAQAVSTDRLESVQQLESDVGTPCRQSLLHCTYPLSSSSSSSNSRSAPLESKSCPCRVDFRKVEHVRHSVG